jgi:pimeloyl-ACP methyl ester carboxylesterase
LTRRTFEAVGDGVRLVGWAEGEGTPVLLLHGGPGLGYEYLDGLAADLDGCAVASYQQRGLAPSTEDGPFGIADHVADIVLALDTLGWGRAVLVGHSWGGHLGLHAARMVPDRILGLLAVDTLGAVGDGGMQEFGATLMGRTPADDVRRIAEIDALGQRGEGSPEDGLEGLRLLWPAYFATREAAPPVPEIRIGGRCSLETMASVERELPLLESSLSRIPVPVGFVRGAGSPMPASASTDAAALIEGAWVETVDGAGHFPWLDVPGSVGAALERLVPARETGS